MRQGRGRTLLEALERAEAGREGGQPQGRAGITPQNLVETAVERERQGVGLPHSQGQELAMLQLGPRGLSTWRGRGRGLSFQDIPLQPVGRGRGRGLSPPIPSSAPPQPVRRRGRGIPTPLLLHPQSGRTCIGVRSQELQPTPPPPLEDSSPL